MASAGLRSWGYQVRKHAKLSTALASYHADLLGDLCTAAALAGMARRLNLAGVDELTVSHYLVTLHFPNVRVVNLHVLTCRTVRSLEPPNRYDFIAFTDEFVRRACTVPTLPLRVSACPQGLFAGHGR